MNNPLYHELEAKLQQLHDRLHIIEQRSVQKIDLINKFGDRQRETIRRTIESLEKENQEKRKRNQNLLNEILFEYNHVQNVKVSIGRRDKSGEKLLQAKNEYKQKVMDASLNTLHRCKLTQLQEKIRQIKTEKNLSLERAAKLRRNTVKENEIMQLLELQRQDLLHALSQEHNEHLTLKANSIILSEQMRANDSVFLENIQRETELTAHETANRVELIQEQSLQTKFPSRSDQLILAATPNYEVQRRSQIFHVDSRVDQSSYQQLVDYPKPNEQEKIENLDQTVALKLSSKTTEPGAIDVCQSIEEIHSPEKERQSDVQLLQTSITNTEEDNFIAERSTHSDDASEFSVVKYEQREQLPEVKNAVDLPSETKKIDENILAKSKFAQKDFHADEFEFEEPSIDVDQRRFHLIEPSNIDEKIQSAESIMHAGADKLADDEFERDREHEFQTSKQKGREKGNELQPSSKIGVGDESAQLVPASISLKEFDFKLVSVVCSALFKVIEAKAFSLNDIKLIYDSNHFGREQSLANILQVLRTHSSSDRDLADAIHRDSTISAQAAGKFVQHTIESFHSIVFPKEAFIGVVSLDKLKKEQRKQQSSAQISAFFEAFLQHIHAILTNSCDVGDDLASNGSMTAAADYLAAVFAGIIADASVTSDVEERNRRLRKVSNLLQITFLNNGSNSVSSSISNTFRGISANFSPATSPGKPLPETSTTATSAISRNQESSFSNIPAKYPAETAAPKQKPYNSSLLHQSSIFDSFALGTSRLAELEVSTDALHVLTIRSNLIYCIGRRNSRRRVHGETAANQRPR